MISEQQKQVLDFFAEGRKLYKLMNFQEAKAAFAKALEINPDDGPAKLYFDRCDYYIQNPPPADWDGVFTMTTK
ncbi:hypothetical protein K7I13_00405 [Brucepastera parasyntrophica]|uniref:tetratricopeptide repeat protein n=1 Tax=Brucepastera parasyntrophica TaxID=2880008 RepID=UPI00210A4213|nr:tetratricopeptide repeat protein [Brucepastera parasyntrophica]ULQ59854.1 hypothetical protein K7I13_00405 [Brucepastera parasyntrophica]